MKHNKHTRARPGAAAARAIGAIGASLIALLACATTALHAQTPAPAASAAADQGDWSAGEITRLDARTLRITLRHGAIKNLGMPPMTMVFKLRDAALLEGLQAGDQVRFRAEPAGSTALVTQIEKLR